MALNKWDQLKSEFIEWSLLDKHQRSLASLPAHETEWAKAKDVSDRTLRNWKNDPAFMEKIEARQKEQALRLPGSTITGSASLAVPESDGSDESDYTIIKAKLIQRAASGDKGALDTYFKTYGKTYVDEENAARRSDFRDIDTDELYTRVLLLVPTGRLEAELKSRAE